MRTLLAIAVAMVFAMPRTSLAEITVVDVTPTHTPKEIEITQERTAKLVTFTVKLSLAESNWVTAQLVADVLFEEQEVFGTAAQVDAPVFKVRFVLPVESAASATLRLGVSAKPDTLGGTSYFIRLNDFRSQSAGEFGGLSSGGPEKQPAPKAKPNESRSQTRQPKSLAESDKSILAMIADMNLEEEHGSSDSVDTSLTIKFLSKDNLVEVRPGSSVFVELPRPTKEFYWHAGYAPEGVGGHEDLPSLFTHVWCRWETDGKLTWKCYGPSTRKKAISGN